MRGSVKNIRIVFLFLLILSVGMSSLYFHTSSPTAGDKHKKEAQGKKEDKSKETVVLSKAFVAVMPFFELDLTQDLYLVQHFDFSEECEEKFESAFIPYSSKYFKTLFCFVISPNAP